MAETYTVLARRYRSQNFSSLVGQEAIAQTLKNAITSHRVAHAFLFTGTRGVGKTSAARILAKALNCPNAKDGEPCNTCAATPPPPAAAVQTPASMAQAVGTGAAIRTASADAALAEEVGRALDRLLGRA